MDKDENLLVDIETHRSWRVPMYTGLVISGVFATLEPSPLVVAQVSHLVAILWSVGMMLSALACLLGSITDRWIGEYTGLPLLASVLALYGGSAILSFSSDNFIILAYGVIIISFAFGLMARWSDVRAIKQAALAGGKERRGA